MILFLQLFYTFFKIGLFGFGGGYAMISMIQGEVVTRYGWLSSSEFTDIVALSQMTPGPIGINSATYVGYTAIVNAGYSHALSGRRSRFPGPASGRSRTAGSRSAGTDEQRKLRHRYLSDDYQHHSVSRCIHCVLPV